MNDRFLSTIFKLREAFHCIAARNVEDLHGSTTIVCWADAFLARLGDAVITIASAYFDVDAQERGEQDSIRAQKNEDMLRAALQLSGVYSQEYSMNML